MIRITRPYYEDCQDGGKITAMIIEEGRESEVWFQTKDEWKSYLCYDRADAFLLNILPHAMKTQQDIVSDAPISETLLYQVRHFQLPCVQKYAYKTEKISIQAEAIADCKKVPGRKIVGTGISNGVDSLYTVYKNINNVEENFRLTHLAYFAIGAAGDFGGEEEKELAEQRLQEVRRFAREINLPVVTLDSNINELFSDEYYIYVVSYRVMAAVLALQLLFDVYYFSSSYEIHEFHFPDNDSEFYDLLSCQNFSTSKVNFYSYGRDASRMEKLRYLAQIGGATYKYLQVCQTSYKNCCRCEKCLRTMAELDLLGATGSDVSILEKYAEVFDVDYYKKNRNRILGFGLSQRKEHSFWDDVYLKLKDQGIPMSVRKWEIWYIFRRFLSRRFRRLSKIYKKRFPNKNVGSSKQYHDLYIRL